VIERLLDETATDVVMLGAGADRDGAVAIESRLGAPGGRRAGSARLLNLVGKTDVGLLIGLVSLCQAFLSNDSGAMHLSAACGVHVTAVFGPTDERATAPLGPHTVLASDTWCRPCHLRECPIDHRCMTRVEPQVVFESIAAALAARGAAECADGRPAEEVAR